VLRLGALVRQRALERWAAKECPLIAAVLRFIGHAAIRNRGTVAGSATHADPAAELPALFVGLDGVAVVRNHARTREVAAHELYRGPLMTALEPDELMIETRWPLPPAGAGWGVHEISRRHGDFALVGAIAVLTVADDAVDRARIAMFGAGPTPVRASGAEKALAGARATRDTMAEAARLAASDLEPDSDIHASARYRRMVGRTLVERALGDALARAGARG
jgi:carbon-monoxide dehydrogenase medium subunit